MGLSYAVQEAAVHYTLNIRESHSLGICPLHGFRIHIQIHGLGQKSLGYYNDNGTEKASETTLWWLCLLFGGFNGNAPLCVYEDISERFK